MKGSYEEKMEAVREAYDALSEDQKAAFIESTERLAEHVKLLKNASNLRWHRCIDSFPHDGVKLGDGECYVYLWMHLNGAPFYIGSGKQNRWLSVGTGARNNLFEKATEKMDAVVYKVATGLDDQEARNIEFCLIHLLTYEGNFLAQRSHNYLIESEKTQIKSHQRYKKLRNFRVVQAERALYNILSIKRDYDLEKIWKEYDEFYAGMDQYIPSPIFKKEKI